MLVSFHLFSNRSDRLGALLKNLEESCEDPSSFEVLVKTDESDPAMRPMLDEVMARRPFAIRCVWAASASSRKGNVLNDLYPLCDPRAYFVCALDDGFRFKSKGWDEKLRAYIGFYPDDIFRLRTQIRLRNYTDYIGCVEAPEPHAFVTKKWIDLTGGEWAPCADAAAFHQCVAFYLARALHPAKEQFNRDIPVWDIEVEGIDAERDPRRPAALLLTHAIQHDAARRGCRLACHIVGKELGYETFQLVDDARRRQVKITNDDRVLNLPDRTGAPIRFSYRLGYWRIRMTNLSWRRKRPARDHRRAERTSVWGRITAELAIARRKRWQQRQLSALSAPGPACANCGQPPIAAEATSAEYMYPPTAVLTATALPWMSRPTREDIILWFRYPHPITPRRLDLILFAPGGARHLDDISVVGRSSAGDGAGGWKVLPSRGADCPTARYQETIRIPPLPDHHRVSLAIDPAIGEQAFEEVGIACFSRSRDHRRNLSEGNMRMAVRSMAVAE